jgi:MFS family permease
MHCPQCGQHQLSDEMRFCSRCGFALGIVTELLVTGGTLPERETESLAARFGGRRRGKRVGLLLMLTAFLLAIIGGIIHDSLVHDQNAPGLAGKLLLFLPAIIIGVAGFVRFFYALLLETNVQGPTPSLAPRATTKSVLHAQDHPALTPSPGVSASSFAPKRGNTREMVDVPSVTENTTKLLDQ